MIRLARPLLQMLVLYAVFMALLYYGAPLLAQHPTEPPFNDPDVQTDCTVWGYDYHLGAGQVLLTPPEGYDEPGEWQPYLYFNGPDGYTPEQFCNAPRFGYLTAGELGATVNVNLFTQPQGELPTGSKGYVIWATDYTTDPFWEWPWGWSALDPETITGAWTFTNAERVFVNGEHVGWTRIYTNPTDTALEGQRIFALGLITGSGGPQGLEGEKYSETWMITFTDVLQ